jgi:hypothetical protein
MIQRVLSLLTTLLVLCDMKAAYIAHYSLPESHGYKDLKFELGVWAELYGIKSPDLYMRFNSHNLGYYQDHQITLLVRPHDFFLNPSFQEVAMAHEFGHYLVREKSGPMETKEEDAAADLVALHLVGYPKMERALSEEALKRSAAEQVEFKSRIEFLDHQPK